MTMYETLFILFQAGKFLIILLIYIDLKNQKNTAFSRSCAIHTIKAVSIQSQSKMNFALVKIFMRLP